jgi:hypothetical protein
MDFTIEKIDITVKSSVKHITNFDFVREVKEQVDGSLIVQFSAVHKAGIPVTFRLSENLDFHVEFYE